MKFVAKFLVVSHHGKFRLSTAKFVIIHHAFQSGDNTQSAFRWAEKEKRIAIQREFDKSRDIAEPSASDTCETLSLLSTHRALREGSSLAGRENSTKASKSVGSPRHERRFSIASYEFQ